jgi:hypothetical protein
MTFGDTLLSIAVAVAAGALVGVERQQAHAERRASDFGGVRTFPLVAMLGAIAAVLAPALGGWIVGAFLAALVVTLGIAQTRTPPESVGVSSELAAIVTFGLGVVSGSPSLMPEPTRFLLVIGVAGATMALLALKRLLHGFVAKVSDDDVYATAKFLLLAVVVIPLLPDKTYGPFSVLNPRKIGLMIALVAGVGFACLGMRENDLFRSAGGLWVHPRRTNSSLLRLWRALSADNPTRFSTLSTALRLRP